MPYLTGPVLPAGTLALSEQPTIPTGDGLVLRPWTAGDAPAVHEAFQDPVMHQWHIRAADSTDEVAGWIEEWRTAWAGERDVQWAVADADTGRLRGRVALRNVLLGDGVAEVAYWTVADARGQGVAARATSALRPGRSTRSASTAWNSPTPPPTRPPAVSAAKAGFTLEGTRRSALLHQDGWHDMHLHARVQGDPSRGPS